VSIGALATGGGSDPQPDASSGMTIAAEKNAPAAPGLQKNRVRMHDAIAIGDSVAWDRRAIRDVRRNPLHDGEGEISPRSRHERDSPRAPICINLQAEQDSQRKGLFPSPVVPRPFLFEAHVTAG
jgi:hypothetical protein